MVQGWILAARLLLCEGCLIFTISYNRNYTYMHIISTIVLCLSFINIMMFPPSHVTSPPPSTTHHSTPTSTSYPLPPTFHCSYCGTTCHNQDAFNNHINGKKHRKQIKKTKTTHRQPYHQTPTTATRTAAPTASILYYM